jgi:DNA replication and repair protein RecF
MQEKSERLGIVTSGSLTKGVEVRLEYRPGLRDAQGCGDGSIEAAAEALRRALAQVAGAERRRGHSLVGPHRDDLRLNLGERDLARFGSAGQQRAALLALKLTRLELYREQAGEAPLLLVDDMDSDLDDAASERLLSRVGRSQTLVTTCKRGSRERYGPASRAYRVRDGAITPDVRGDSAENAEALDSRDGAQ